MGHASRVPGGGYVIGSEAVPFSVIPREAVRRPSRGISSYRRVLASQPISDFGGSLDSQGSLGMTEDFSGSPPLDWSLEV